MKRVLIGVALAGLLLAGAPTGEAKHCGKRCQARTASKHLRHYDSWKRSIHTPMRQPPGTLDDWLRHHPPAPPHVPTPGELFLNPERDCEDYWDNNCTDSDGNVRPWRACRDATEYPCWDPATGQPRIVAPLG